MFGWIFKKKAPKVEEEIKQSFSAVKKDMDMVGTWIKHLDAHDKQLFDLIHELKLDLSSVRDEVGGLREALDVMNQQPEDQQLFKKLPVFSKQTAVEDVQEAVQTGVQTGNFYDILKSLSGNERLLIFTLMNSDMKLSYEDLALLLGKERSTIRGQINAIKQKREGLIEEISEKSGKKRVFVPEEIKEKLAKYAKVRVEKGRKVRTSEKDGSNIKNDRS